MRGKKFSIGMMALLAAIAVTLFMTGSRVFGQQEKLLYSFSDAASPAGGLIFDKAGNLYGMTTFGGTYGYGAVYELSTDGNERVLYSFNPAAGDGGNPLGGLIFDDAGNLYGTTYAGGSGKAGTVFELTPHGAGLWEERILHNFKINPPDGHYPSAGLIFDATGNLYGTASEGGSGPCTYGAALIGCGVVFELSPKAGGVWAAKVIYSFLGAYTDGQSPIASLVFDSAGNLYGTTVGGGAAGPYESGTVFELSPTALEDGRRKYCITSPPLAPTASIWTATWPWTPRAISTAPRIQEGCTTSGHCSNCRRAKAGVGRRQSCIASAAPETGEPLRAA